jgi:hypothetical protein
MKRWIVCLVGVCTVATAFIVLQSGILGAQQRLPQLPPEKAAALQGSSSILVDNPQTAVACQTCFTCGGDWPIFAGSNFTSGAIERGPGCSGDLTTTGDTSPFLCCR